MATSAFKSTSKRGSCANAGTSSSARQHQTEDAGRKVPSRRSRSVSAVSRSRLEEPAPLLEFSNKRDNPLFCASSASPTDSEKLVAEKGGDDASGHKRGRSTSRSSSLHSQQSSHRKDCGRSLSRVDMGRRRRSVSKDHYGKPESNGQVSTWDDGISTSSFSETEEKTIKAVFEQMKSFQNEHPISDSGSGIYEIVRAEVRRAMADIRSDLENAIHVRDAPVSMVSNAFHPPSEMVEPDGIELVADIRREYAIKLQQTQERARKIRAESADLDVEVQRSQELSRILKEMVPDPKCNEMQRSQSKQKTSIEQRKMSRRLTEEAMNYFDECVSISTFDTSDFSSPEDKLPSAVDDNMPWCNSNIIENNDPSSSSVCVASDPINCIEVGSHQSRTTFSFSTKSMASVATHDLKNYISKFGKELQECDDHSNVRSSYNGDDYDVSTSEESLLFEKITFRHRIESGCLLICDIRTF